MSALLRSHIHHRPLLWSLITTLAASCTWPTVVHGQTASQHAAPLYEKLRWARLELVMGRLELRDIRRGQNRSITVNHHETGIREHINFRIEGNKLALHYERQSPSRSLVLDASGRHQLSVRQTGMSNATARVHFQQDNERVLLRIGDADSAEYEAEHLWLLMLQYPQPSRQYLIPLLESLRRDWHLGRALEEVEGHLVRAATSGTELDVQQLREHIAQLGRGTFRQRQAADLAIRRTGQKAVGFLAELDETRLNAEQRFRLRRITASLLSRQGDNTTSVTTWLESSPAAWLCMMQHDDPLVRKQAQTQLASLLGRPVPFDPSGLPEARAGQIANLRESLRR